MSKQILIIKHIDIEGPGSIEKFFQNTAWSLRTVDLSKGESLPESLEDIEAIVSLGGPMNVYEENKYPFLQDENEILKKAIKEEIPILGICLGAQLLAKALGAQVKKAKTKEIGWHKINLTAYGQKDSLFEGLSAELDVFQWHEDTFDIPEKAMPLATSSSCQNQAFKWGKNAYGLQFHLEVTPEMVESWINAYAREGESVLPGVDNMLIQTYKKAVFLEKQANLSYLNFARIIDVSKK